MSRQAHQFSSMDAHGCVWKLLCRIERCRSWGPGKSCLHRAKLWQTFHINEERVNPTFDEVPRQFLTLIARCLRMSKVSKVSWTLEGLNYRMSDFDPGLMFLHSTLVKSDSKALISDPEVRGGVRPLHHGPGASYPHCVLIALLCPRGICIHG